MFSSWQIKFQLVSLLQEFHATFCLLSSVLIVAILATQKLLKCVFRLGGVQNGNCILLRTTSFWQLKGSDVIMHFTFLFLVFFHKNEIDQCQENLSVRNITGKLSYSIWCKIMPIADKIVLGHKFYVFYNINFFFQHKYFVMRTDQVPNKRLNY